MLRDLKARGIEAPRLLMADGNAAIWGAVRQVWPEAGEQRCWNHKMRNVLDRLPQREQSEAKDLLRAVVYAPSRAEAVNADGRHGVGGFVNEAVEYMAPSGACLQVTRGVV